MVNEAWAIGDASVLRIIRLEECDVEAEREAAVVPVVVAAGVRTPRIVVADFQRDLVPRPYTIYERAAGTLMADLDPGLPGMERAYREIGRQLAAVHAIRPDADLAHKLRVREPFAVGDSICKAVDAGVLSTDEASDVERWFLDAMATLNVDGPRLIHADIHPWNATVNGATGDLEAILDWGDASIGDPSIEFASMPLFTVPAMLAGYREAGGTADASLLTRSLLHGLKLGLWETRMLDPTAFDRKWWRMPEGGWREYVATAERLLDAS